MAEKADKKHDAPPAKAEEKKSSAPASKGGAAGGGGLLAKTPVLIGGVMLIEAVVLFAGFKFILGGAPKAAAGAELAITDPSAASDDKKTDASDDKKSDGEKKDDKSADGMAAKKVDKKTPVEIPVLEFRAPNKQLGKTFIYDVSIFAVAKIEHQKKVEETIAARKNLITDRIRTIIAQCDPDKLGGGSEPGLETLRRQVKYQLDEIVGEGLIDEVLVPRCMPFRADY
jgi:flagellar basal body-associated protein FliL